MSHAEQLGTLRSLDIQLATTVHRVETACCEHDGGLVDTARVGDGEIGKAGCAFAIVGKEPYRQRTSARWGFRREHARFGIKAYPAGQRIAIHVAGAKGHAVQVTVGKRIIRHRPGVFATAGNDPVGDLRIYRCRFKRRVVGIEDHQPESDRGFDIHRTGVGGEFDPVGSRRGLGGRVAAEGASA